MAEDQDKDGLAASDPATGEPYVNRGELARAFKTTEPTVDRWCAEGCPCVEKGSNGRPC